MKKIKIYNVKIYNDDTIENVKYKMSSVFDTDKFYYNYYFFLKHIK